MVSHVHRYIDWLIDYVQPEICADDTFKKSGVHYACAAHHNGVHMVCSVVRWAHCFFENGLQQGPPKVILYNASR